MKASIRNAFALTWVVLLVFCATVGWGAPEATGEESEAQLYIVRLKDPAIIERLVSMTPDAVPSQRRTLLTESMLNRLDSRVNDSQQAFLGRARTRIDAYRKSSRSDRSRDFEVIGSCRTVTNSIIVRGTPEFASELLADPSVDSIHLSQPRRPLLDTAVELLNVPAAWEKLGGVQGAGAGIKIGIIDSGIEHTHSMLAGNGMVSPPGYPKGNQDYTNGKIIVARSFHQYFPNSQPNTTPADEMGHGTSVATIAAGEPVISPQGLIQGVAPKAFIGNYKVFGSSELNGSTTTAAIIAALDSAVRDGMDVVNMSLGGPAADPATDPEQQAVANAVSAGVVVVVAAGNTGPGVGTAEAPGTSPQAITVGAIGNGKTLGSGVRVYASPDPPPDLRHILYAPGQGVVIETPVGVFPLRPVKIVDNSELGCNPLPPNSLKGSIALVRRGTCYFQVKADNVFAAGAEGLIVYNNTPGSAVTMAFDTIKGAGGPAVMIAMEPGTRLRDLALSQKNVSVQLDSTLVKSSFPAPSDELEAFSSRGPTLTQEVKPDLVAIGSRLYAGAKGGQFSSALRGTSFSAPMVAGAAALLRQLNPTWSVAEIKSALVSTANTEVYWNGRRARVNEIGNGILDMRRASAAVTSLSPVSLSFGVETDSSMAGQSASREIVVRNRGTSPSSFSTNFVSTVPNDSVAIVVIPSSFSLEPGEEAHLTVTAAFGAKIQPGIFEGRVYVTNLAGAIYTVPVWGGIAIPDHSTKLTVSDEPNAQFSSLEAAVRAAQPGNVIEVLGGGSYPTNISIRFNDDGLPLNGLTIQGAPGYRPTLDGSLLGGSEPVLSVEGLSQVTIQGLRIFNTSTAIEFRNTTGVVRDIVFNTSMANNSRGLNANSSDLHIFENEFSNSASSAISLQSSNALIQRNIVGSPSGSLQNGGHGISTSYGDAVSIFDNSIEANGTLSSGQGIRVSSSATLIKGNRISGTRSSTGDGILLLGPLSKMEGWNNWVTGNERAGLSLFSGASARLSFSKLQDNGTAGSLVNPDSSLTLNGVWLNQNLNGIISTDSSLTLTNSIVSASASQGIRQTNGILKVVNTTIYGNGEEGIWASGSADGEVANSVVFNNYGSADVSGLGAGDVTFSLTGDGQFTPAQNNLSGDPQLVDPENGDFAPTAQSPLIDSGSDNIALSLFSTDFYGRARPVDGDSDGLATVDVGALEYASDSAPPLLLPVFTAQPGSFVGLALTNNLDEPMSEGRLRQGLNAPASQILTDITLIGHFHAPGRTEQQVLQARGQTQKSLLLTEIFNNLGEGWVEIRPGDREMTGFTLTGDYRSTFLDGIALLKTPASTLIFPEVRTTGNRFTTIYLINPHPQPVTVGFRWHGPSPAPVVNRTILAGDLLKLSAAELFPGKQGGYIRVTSPDELPVFGMELYGSAESLAALPALLKDEASADLFGAQLASMEGIESYINLVNVGEVSDEVTLEAVSDTGKVQKWVSRTLSPGEQLRASAGDLFGWGEDGFVGWLRIRSAEAKLLGSITFEDPGGAYSAALPLSNQRAREFILSHVAQLPGIFTGVAILNPGPNRALFSVEVFDRSGKRTGVTLTELDGYSKRSLLLKEWIPGFQDQARGFIRVRSNRPLQGFEIFGSNQFMATVPPQVLLQ